jgi:hypothetical protein
MEFKVGDRVHYNDSLSSGIGVIDYVFNAEGPSKPMYAIENVMCLYGMRTRFFWSEELTLVKEETQEEKEKRELSRLEHIGIDPFGEEIWL